MDDGLLHVLFVSTGNSSRSIMAEAMLNNRGRAGFKAYSAGRHPEGHIKPLALETLSQTGCDTSDLHPKSWDEFATIQAPRIDAVISLGENEFHGHYPIWYSDPVIVHWHVSTVESSTHTESERKYAYRIFFTQLEQLVLRLSGLDLGAVRGHDLERQLKAIAPKFS